MANLYITEYASTGWVNGVLPIGMETPNAEQVVAVSGTSAQSSVLKNNTQCVRLNNGFGAGIGILFGANPTALTSSRRIANNQSEYFAVPLNSGYKIAVIQSQDV